MRDVRKRATREVVYLRPPGTVVEGQVIHIPWVVNGKWLTSVVTCITYTVRAEVVRPSQDEYIAPCGQQSPAER